MLRNVPGVNKEKKEREMKKVRQTFVRLFSALFLLAVICILPSDHADAATRIKGIDVSRYQGAINWKAVKQDGIKFTMIGVGYVINGKEQSDPRFEYNIRNAIQNNVNVGVYIYSHAHNVKEAEKEAAFVLKQIKGYKISYPVAFDIEDEIHMKLTTKQRTDITLAFLRKIEAAGYYPMIYASQNWLYERMDLSRLTKYDKWVARWASSCSFSPTSMWQYSSTGRVKGISTVVDLDYDLRDYTKIIRPRTQPGPNEKETPGWHSDEYGTWYVKADGSRVTNTKMTIDGKTYYFDSLGYRKSGWQKLGKNYYYFSRQTGAMRKTPGWFQINGKTYYLDKNGARQTGWLKVGADTYYLNADGAKAFGWLKLNGRKYFLKLKRVPATIIILAVGCVVATLIQAITSDWMDVVSIYICPLGALLAAVMLFWVAGKDFALDEVNRGRDKPIGSWFYPLAKYVYCILCVVALVAGAILGGIG